MCKVVLIASTALLAISYTLANCMEPHRPDRKAVIQQTLKSVYKHWTICPEDLAKIVEEFLGTPVTVVTLHKLPNKAEAEDLKRRIRAEDAVILIDMAQNNPPYEPIVLRQGYCHFTRCIEWLKKLEKYHRVNDEHKTADDSQIFSTDCTDKDFSGFNLAGLDLSCGLCLVRASFNWANLSGTNLTNSLLAETSFIGALTSGTNFTNANLTKAQISAQDLKSAIISSNTILPDFSMEK